MVELIRAQGVPTLLSTVVGMSSLKDINCTSLSIKNSKIIDQKNF